MKDALAYAVAGATCALIGMVTGVAVVSMDDKTPARVAEVKLAGSDAAFIKRCYEHPDAHVPDLRMSQCWWDTGSAHRTATEEWVQNQ